MRSRVLRALRYRNFRLFFVGQSISLIGTWMAQVATAWLVYRMTGSAFLLGAVGFAGQIASFLLAPLAGVLSDRVEQRRILLAAQWLAALHSLALAALILSGRIEVWQIIALSIAQGIITAFDIPARQTFMVRMVGDRADLPNAIALNAMMFHGARLIGPSIAGFIIAVGGEGVVFLIDSVSYLAVIATLMMMRVPPFIRPPRRRVWHEVMEGVSYVAGSLPIRTLMMVVAFTSLVALPYSVLLPLVASERLGGGPSTLGFLTGMAGFGALCGSLYLASRRSVRGLVRRAAMAGLAFGAAIMLFSMARNLEGALVALFAAGFAMIVQLAASNTVIQTLVEDDKRGRVMSIYIMSFMGMSPWGSLMVGALASRIGVAPTLQIEGAACMAGAAVFASQLPRLRAVIRPLYVKKGILPEAAAATTPTGPVFPSSG